MPLEKLTNYTAKELEEKVRAYWEKEQVPQKTQKTRKDKKFFLLDGPPYTNAAPHIGHVKTTACKDIWTKYKQMRGFTGFLQPGFDCHGLPTEVMVEKELKVVSKSDIENKIGIAQFDAKCLEKAVNTEKNWVDYYKLLGAWRAYFEPYFTYKDTYIESAWWTAKNLHEKGLFVEGNRAIHWCPRCETSLSGYEVSDSYKDLQAPSLYLKFKVKNVNEYLLVWTTTPWTLPSNVAIAVHPKETYVRATCNGENYILAKKRVESVEKETGKKFKIISEFSGSELDGLEYEPLMDFDSQKFTGGHKIILSIVIMANKKYKKHGYIMGDGKATVNLEEYDEFVTMDAGSGLVHSSPANGQSDNFVGKYYDLPIVSTVDEKGRFIETVGELAGTTTTNADPLIIEKLDQQGKIFNVEYFTHRASVCWRCKTPLIFRLSKQWYLKVDPLKEKILAENENINWMPDFGKTKFQNWIADREDWCLSQQRYWGIPIPIWTCEKCNSHEIIGSRAELIQKSLTKLDEKKLTDLHRHVVDNIVLKCSACGGNSKRIKDIFTVWFDSGIAPWASLGYPFKNKELFESMFPVDLVTESQDQVRGWFDSLMLCSVGVFGHTPFKSVAMMGWVVDEKGDKMSKSVGNVIPAAEGIAKLGADVIRLYYCSEVAPWEVQKFSFEQAKKPKQALSILWNCFTFLETYKDANCKLKILTQNDVKKFALEDKWILSRLDSTITQFLKHMDAFEFHSAGRAAMDFIVDDLSRAYVKLIRDRMNANADKTSRQQSEQTLGYCVYTISKLLAPITPFISDYIYLQLQPLFNEKFASVHLASLPSDSGFTDVELEKQMREVFAITEAANACRQEAGIKLRWPIREVILVNKEKVAAVENLQGILSKINNCESVILKTSEPTGKKFASKDSIVGKVFISTQRDEELVHQSMYREVVRSIQAGRKNTGLVVNDKIELYIHTDDAKLQNYLKKMQKELSQHVGATKVTFAEEGGENDASVQVEDTLIAIRFSKV